MTDPTGQYQMKSTGLHYEQTTDGQIKTIKTYAGTATRFGQISGTLIITQPLAEAGGNGLCSWAGKALLEDGTIIGSVGKGPTTRIGNELRANVSIIHTLSDGTQVRTEGVMEHGAGTFSGAIYDVD